MKTGELRQLLNSIFQESLKRINLEKSAEDYCHRSVSEREVDLIALGKAAPELAIGAMRALGSRCQRALVVTGTGTSIEGLDRAVEVRRAAHPYPAPSSVDAARRCLEFVAQSRAKQVAVFVSGGTSSMICAPPTGVSLQDKTRVTSQLLRSGASIKEVNTVRRHFSRIKGGRLAAASPVPTACAIVSDVIGGLSHDVGSGPACEDPSTAEEAIKTALQYLDAEVVKLVTEHVAINAPKLPQGTTSQIILKPEDFAQEFVRGLKQVGRGASFRVMEGLDVQELVRRLLEIAGALKPQESVVVCCEPTISLPRDSGLGGRAGWVALAASRNLPEGVALLCGATDGIDGSSTSAGACISADQSQGITSVELDRALAHYDDASVHSKLGTQLNTGATGLNFTDVYVVGRC